MQSSGKDDRTAGSGRRWVRDIAPFLTMGIQLAVSVVLFFFLGRWLDGLWGTAPWLMLAGLLLGAVGGFVQFFRSVAAIGRQETDEEKQKDGR